MKMKNSHDNENLIVDAILAFLQEKRTALSMVRIGITTIVAQIAVFGFLIATSRYYRWVEVLHLVIPFALLNIIVLGFAGYFIIRPVILIHQLDRQILRHKKRLSGFAGLKADPRDAAREGKEKGASP